MSVSSPARVASRYLKLAARPIPIDKDGLKTVIHQGLVPDIRKWLSRRPDQNEPIGLAHNIAQASFIVEDSNQRDSRRVMITVNSRPSNAKGVAVLDGSSNRKTKNINLYMNGALSPADFLVPTKWNDRMAPLWECTHETCLPFGLYSLLLHEVTHSADVSKAPMRYSPKEVLERGEAVWGGYVNDPQEVRAFMQEVVDAAERMATKLRTDFKSNQQLVNTVLMLTTTWGIVEKHLRPQEKARILRAVYEMLDRMGLLVE